MKLHVEMFQIHVHLASPNVLFSVYQSSRICYILYLQFVKTGFATVHNVTVRMILCTGCPFIPYTAWRYEELLLDKLEVNLLVSDVWMHFIWILVRITLICVYYQHHTYCNDIFTMYFTIYCWWNKILTPYVSVVYQCSLKLTAPWRWL